MGGAVVERAGVLKHVEDEERGRPTIDTSRNSVNPRVVRSFADASRVLGELELKLMRVVWTARRPVSVRDVLATLDGTKPAYTTVMSTMDRLYKKRILVRAKQGNAFMYQAAMNQAEYQQRIVAEVVRPLLEQTAAPVLSAFVEVAAGVDTKHLGELERLIAARRRSRHAGR